MKYSTEDDKVVKVPKGELAAQIEKQWGVLMHSKMSLLLRELVSHPLHLIVYSSQSLFVPLSCINALCLLVEHSFCETKAESQRRNSGGRAELGLGFRV